MVLTTYSTAEAKSIQLYTIINSTQRLPPKGHNLDHSVLVKFQGWAKMRKRHFGTVTMQVAEHEVGYKANQHTQWHQHTLLANLYVT